MSAAAAGARWRLVVNLVTPTEPLSARGLIERHGGWEVEFRNLTPLAEQAIRKRAAEHLDPGAQPDQTQDANQLCELPPEALQQAVLAAVQREGAPWPCSVAATAPSIEGGDHTHSQREPEIALCRSSSSG